MELETRPRQQGEVPAGMFVLVPLMWLPLGAWLVQEGWLVFGVCGMKKVFGIPCLMCGATRSTVWLLHGQPLEALAMQPMVAVGWVALLAWGTTSFVAFQFDRVVSIGVGRGAKRLIAAFFLLGPLVNWAYLIQMGV